MTSTLPTWFDDVETSPDAVSDHVVLRLDGSRYAVCATDVAEVVEVPVVTRVPGVASWVVGVANWRGHVLPVIDLRPVLGVRPAPSPSSARLVVVAVEDVEVGILADAVLGLAEVPDPLSPTAPALLRAGHGLVVGAVDSGPAGPLAVLSTDAVLALRVTR